MTTGLSAERAAKTFGSVAALRGCTAAIPAGCVCALIGLNGSGKTTLLRAAAGLLRLDGGSITAAGSPVAFARPAPVSYLAQARPLHPALRPAEIISYARALAGGRLDAGFAARWLDRYEVPAGRRAGQLSGGQRTQVALAVALAREAAVVALDEPLADLDPLAREQVAADLQEIAGRGRTVVVSSHAISELTGWCDYIVVLDTGGVVLEGYAQQIAGGGPLADVIRDALRDARGARRGAAGSAR